MKRTGTEYWLLRLSCGHTACELHKPRRWFWCHAHGSFQRIEASEHHEKAGNRVRAGG